MPDGSGTCDPQPPPPKKKETLARLALDIFKKLHEKQLFFLLRLMFVDILAFIKPTLAICLSELDSKSLFSR